MPPPLPVVLPLLGDELPLLLQPAAAKAITARAAIAEVRFITFVFLSFDRGHPAAGEARILARFGLRALRQLRDARVTKSFCCGRIGLEIGSRQRPEQGGYRREQAGR